MKPFNPDPFTSGAPIAWSHFKVDGQRIERTGVVWDRAPSTDGATIVCWVIPDEPSPEDLGPAIAVGKSSRRYQTYGHSVPVSKGDLFSSDDPATPLGCLTAVAARKAVKA
jgi:hypothetical protein